MLSSPLNIMNVSWRPRSTRGLEWRYAYTMDTLNHYSRTQEHLTHHQFRSKRLIHWTNIMQWEHDAAHTSLCVNVWCPHHNPHSHLIYPSRLERNLATDLAELSQLVARHIVHVTWPMQLLRSVEKVSRSTELSRVQPCHWEDSATGSTELSRVQPCHWEDSATGSTELSRVQPCYWEVGHWLLESIVNTIRSTELSRVQPCHWEVGHWLTVLIREHRVNTTRSTEFSRVQPCHWEVGHCSLESIEWTQSGAQSSQEFNLAT